MIRTVDLLDSPICSIIAAIVIVPYFKRNFSVVLLLFSHLMQLTSN